jgi:hypothetical protein
MDSIGLLLGAAFGGLLAAARLNDYDVIHNMLLLREPDVFLLMGAAVAVAAPALWLLERARWRTPLGGPLELDRGPVTSRHLWGSLLFGAGWAVTGACPGTALAMPAAGVALGLPVIAGLFAGVLLRDRIAARATTRLTVSAATDTPPSDPIPQSAEGAPVIAR